MMHANSFNIAILAGRVTDEPIYKTALKKDKSETQLIRFTLATNYLYLSSASEKYKEYSSFHRVSFFGRRAGWIRDRLSKGDLILVQGRIDNNVWVDPNGIKRRITQIQGQELVFLVRPKKSVEKDAPAPEPDEPESDDPETQDNETEDEAPF